jgi:hypothetical protein
MVIGTDSFLMGSDLYFASGQVITHAASPYKIVLQNF